MDGSGGSTSGPCPLAPSAAAAAAAGPDASLPWQAELRAAIEQLRASQAEEAASFERPPPSGLGWSPQAALEGAATWELTTQGLRRLLRETIQSSSCLIP
jgi:hypothetical protein